MDAYNQPPYSSSVNARTLARIFGDFTNSYKFLFFIAFLESLERARFDVSTPLVLKEIVIDMLALAWYPHVYFRLSFGKQDKIARELDRTAQGDLLDRKLLKPWDRQTLRTLISAKTQDTDLDRFVPFRLIRPFFPEATGIKDHQVNSRVAELAETYFAERKPPYRFDSTRTMIHVHPDWAIYFADNLSILKSWASWNFLQYMQKCNPNVPAIASKLFPVSQRESLKRQTHFWEVVLRHEPQTCIYSGEPIPERFSLDHYVPWSFVVHDQLWNLVPTSPSVNSSKSDKLPSRKYFDAFVTLQCKGLNLSRNLMSDASWRDYTADYMTDLSIKDVSQLLSTEGLKSAYELNVLPLISLATANGFTPDWQCAAALPGD